MRWAPSVAVAVVSSSLAIVINFATSIPNSWWLWVGVIFLTLISAAITYALDSRSKSNPVTPNSRNYVGGNVDGDAVQARDIGGDVTFGDKRIKQSGRGKKSIENSPDVTGDDQ